MSKLVLVRHGQSQWNAKNLFTGWTDIDLSEKGKEEAREAGRKLKRLGIEFDKGFSSALKRSIHTLDLILEEMNLQIPTQKSWKLNERHYGSLQGQDKKKIKEKYGEEQVQIWRRSFLESPPPLKKAQDLKDHPLYPDLKQSPSN